MNQDALMAILRPQLSAKDGTVKNPNKLPMKIMEVRTVVIPLSSQMRYVGSKPNTIELA